MCAISSCRDLKLGEESVTCREATGSAAPRLPRCPGSASAGAAARSRPEQLTVPAPFRRSWVGGGLLFVELFVMLLEDVPLLLGVHLLHFLAEGEVVVPQNLEALVEPLESLEHGHAALLPEHARDLRLLRPHRLFLLLLVAVELGVLVVAHRHRPALLEKLRIRVHRLFGIQRRRLHQCRVLSADRVVARHTAPLHLVWLHVLLAVCHHVGSIILAILRSCHLRRGVCLIALLLRGRVASAALR